MKNFLYVLILLVIVVVTPSSWMLYAEKSPGGVPVAERQTRIWEPVKPLTAPAVVDREKVELGKKLFFDPRLSQTGFISCNSCHNLSMGGSDNQKTSVGHTSSQGALNTPTVLNSSISFAQFWNGRSKNLKELLSIGDYAYGGRIAFIVGGKEQREGYKELPGKPSDIPPAAEEEGEGFFNHNRVLATLQ